ncbi:MAG: PilN domain-containing protein [Candidatus Methylomirabilia bacterium]
MIRVNLLAKKTSKKKTGAIQHLAIGAGALVIVALALGWVWADQNGKLTALRSQIAKQEAEKVRLKNVNEEKGRFEKEKGELERKLAIITKLQKERIVPVHLLDELTRVIDAGTPIWITSYAYTKGGVSLDGYSLSNEALRPMVDNLEKSPYYKEVELLYSERNDLQGRQVFRFSIKAGVEQPE